MQICTSGNQICLHWIQHKCKPTCDAAVAFVLQGRVLGPGKFGKCENLCETSRPHLLIHVLFFQTMIHIHAELRLTTTSNGTLLVSIQYYKYHAVDIILFCLLRQKEQKCKFVTMILVGLMK